MLAYCGIMEWIETYFSFFFLFYSFSLTALWQGQRAIIFRRVIGPSEIIKRERERERRRVMYQPRWPAYCPATIRGNHTEATSALSLSVSLSLTVCVCIGAHILYDHIIYGWFLRLSQQRGGSCLERSPTSSNFFFFPLDRRVRGSWTDGLLTVCVVNCIIQLEGVGRKVGGPDRIGSISTLFPSSCIIQKGSSSSFLLPTDSAAERWREKYEDVKRKETRRMAQLFLLELFLRGENIRRDQMPPLTPFFFHPMQHILWVI